MCRVCVANCDSGVTAEDRELSKSLGMLKIDLFDDDGTGTSASESTADSVGADLEIIFFFIVATEFNCCLFRSSRFFFLGEELVEEG